jgi:hypothetical protein
MKSSICIITIAIWSSAIMSTGLYACSVCRCGDNAFQFSDRGFVLSDQSENHRFAININNLLSSKSAGLSGNEGPGTESQREIRPSARFSYILLENLSFSLDTPLQFRRVETSNSNGINHLRSSGLGDFELSGIWMRNLWNNEGLIYTAGLSLALKMPSGNNNIKQSGERLDEHLQAGTGSYDWQLGTALSRVTCSSRYFTSFYLRRNGINNFKYRYGNALLFNLGGQWPFNDQISGLVQFNGRYAGRDRDQTIAVENTGGWVTYITPGARILITELIAFSASLQIPIYEDLYGNQSEKVVLNAGFNIQL